MYACEFRSQHGQACSNACTSLDTCLHMRAYICFKIEGYTVHMHEWQGTVGPLVLGKPVFWVLMVTRACLYTCLHACLYTCLHTCRTCLYATVPTHALTSSMNMSMLISVRESYTRPCVRPHNCLHTHLHTCDLK